MHSLRVQVNQNETISDQPVSVSGHVSYMFPNTDSSLNVVYLHTQERLYPPPPPDAIASHMQGNIDLVHLLDKSKITPHQVV